MRVVDAATTQTSTFAGTGTSGSAGVGGPANATGLATPIGLAFNPTTGTLYISNNAGQTILAVPPGGATTSVYAGKASIGGYSGNGGPATAATLNQPAHCATASNGDLYFAEQVRSVAASEVHLLPTRSSTCRRIASSALYLPLMVQLLHLRVRRACKLCPMKTLSVGLLSLRLWPAELRLVRGWGPRSLRVVEESVRRRRRSCFWERFYLRCVIRKVLQSTSSDSMPCFAPPHSIL